MDLHTILTSKPHNAHYVKRYIRFIEQCAAHNQSAAFPKYTEKHHICPKAKDMFPEYKCLKANPWNLIVLTFRQHIIAHVMLWKAYNNTSQTLSVIRTHNQYHTRNMSLKTINSKLLETIKKDLSDKRKGVFAGGYDANGKPIVSDETRKKLSAIKTEFYKDPVNRAAQALACKGTGGRGSDLYRKAALNRSAEHKAKLQLSISKAWHEKRESGSTKRIKDGIYITPIGVFTAMDDYRKYCRNNTKPFSIHNIKKNPLLNKSVLGKTPLELGFSFIQKTDPLFEQYCVDLNQGHPPEPTHPLSSELSDCLSRETLRRR